MKREIRAILLTLCMVLALLPGMALAEEGEITVSFDANGGTFGTAAIEGVTVAEDGTTAAVVGQGVGFSEKLSAAADALAGAVSKAEDGANTYIFDGWYTAAMGGSEVTAFEAKGTATYYAHWKEQPVFAEAEITGTGTQTDTVITVIVTITGAAFDPTAENTDNWSVIANSVFPPDSITLSENRTQAALTFTATEDLDRIQIIAARAVYTGSSDSDGDFLGCMVAITANNSETPPVKPVLTAAPSSAAAGTAVFEVVIAADCAFSDGVMDAANHVGLDSFFSVDTGETGFVWMGSSAIEQSAAEPAAIKLTFHAADGAQAGELKISAKGSAFAGNADDTEPVAITVTGSDDASGSISLPNFNPTGTSTAGTTTSVQNTPPSDSKTTADAFDGVTAPETVKGSDSKEVVVETRPDGAVAITAAGAGGNKSEVVKYADGSTVTTVEKIGGGSSTTVVSASGQVTAQVTLPPNAAALAGGRPVVLPMPEAPLTGNAASAPVVTVNTSSIEPVMVQIPMERTTPGTVAVLVKADGSETVVKTSLAVSNGVTLAVADGATVKVVENSKSFADTVGHWAEDAVAFAAAHELFNGTGEDSFAPDGTMTRAMLITVLARYDGVDTEGGVTWYAKSVDWAAANGISSGEELEAPVSREQLAVMLYRYASGAGLDISARGALEGFSDADSVSDYAVEAMAWAVGAGIISGTDQGELNPGGSATRAEVAVILMRFCEKIAQ